MYCMLLHRNMCTSYYLHLRLWLDSWARTLNGKTVQGRVHAICTVWRLRSWRPLFAPPDGARALSDYTGGPQQWHGFRLHFCKREKSNLKLKFLGTKQGLLYILIKSRQIGWVPGPSCWSPSCSVDTTAFASARKETQLVFYVWFHT